MKDTDSPPEGTRETANPHQIRPRNITQTRKQSTPSRPVKMMPAPDFAPDVGASVIRIDPALRALTLVANRAKANRGSRELFAMPETGHFYWPTQRLFGPQLEPIGTGFDRVWP